ncbi:hypothetical protein [Streptomyces clavuligerus]|uniref:hypothetical protein n=1 Tax=Streptomyces clavuligerus TaxID=1901 RepID=UPI00018008B5|nr:hypothetical protein [Streptomyces clavuligerus]EDY52981.1 hypothetical protein SSCG_06063 [Streptomyces clavuligerus]WDN56003.1 hypothetical protein LL058_29395 [Streptomyces clavuligerus]
MTDPAAATEATGLRERYAAAIWERMNPEGRYADCEPRWRADAEADADAVLAVRDEEMARLRARITALEHVAEGNKKHVQMLVPELRQATVRAEKAEAAIDRAIAACHDLPYQYVRPILEALDQEATP